MKILWLSHLVPYPPKGGVLQRSYNLVRETCKYHDLTLLAFIQTDLIKSRLKDKESGLAEAREHLSQFCDRVIFVEIPCETITYGKFILALKSLLTRDPYTVNWLKSKHMFDAIRKECSITEYDLIHFDTISLGPYINEFPNTLKVLDHHNIESHMMLRRATQETNLLKKIYYHIEGRKLLQYEKDIYPKFQSHLTCSVLDSDRLYEIDHSLDIVDIPNGVDIDYFYPQGGNETESHLVFAGSLSWYPNKDAMLFFAKEIWPLLRKKSANIVMNVVGSSPPSELLEIASKDKNFRVHGFVDDVREYISSASIYVCPIRDGGGTKLKILDAFAMGMATVSHPVACEGISAHDGINVLFASTPDEFTHKIMALMQDKELRNQLGTNARKTATDEYAYTGIGRRLSEHYMRIVKNNN